MPVVASRRGLFDGVTTELTPSERLILVYVRYNGPVRQKGLYEESLVSDGSTAMACESLGEQGLIERTRPVQAPGGSPWLWTPDYHDPPTPDQLLH